MRDPIEHVLDGAAFGAGAGIFIISLVAVLTWLAKHVPGFDVWFLCSMVAASIALIIWRGYAWYRRTRA